MISSSQNGRPSPLGCELPPIGARFHLLTCLLVCALPAAAFGQGISAEPGRPPGYVARPKTDNLGGPPPLQPAEILRAAFQAPAPAGQAKIRPIQASSGGIEQLTAPRPTPSSPLADEFQSNEVRLPLLDAAQSPVGTTPHASPQTLQQFGQFVERTIDPQTTFDLVQGRPRLLMLKQKPDRIQIGDENVATYQLITDREISLVGNTIGTTILNLWFEDGQAPEGQRILSYLVRVLPDPESKQRLERIYEALEAEINRNFPNSVVKLSLVGDKVVVRGEAKDVVEAAQILQVVGANAPGQQRQQQQQGQGGRQGNFNLQNVPYDVTTQNQNIWGTPGEVVNAQYESSILGAANQVLRVNANVINLLRVPGEQQIMLRVTVAEVDRNAARSIGLNFNMFPNTANTMNSVSGGLASSSNAFPYVFQQLSSTLTGNLPLLLDNGQISLAINALRTLSLARSLAEPNLVTANGQQASTHVGSNFPVPNAVATFGAVGQGVAFVPVGVSLSFWPVITDHDRVRLRVSATVSSIDAALTTSVGGSSVPGTDSRTVSTTVELRDGQTLAIAGLIQNNLAATASRVPLFGDLPLLGTLFGSRSTSSQEQELVVLVTPELVHPLEACHTPPIPGADIFEPGDIEFYLFNRIEGIRNYDFRTATRTDWDRMHVYERCEEQLIIGAQGRTYGCCGGGAGQSPCSCQPATAHAGWPTASPTPPGSGGCYTPTSKSITGGAPTLAFPSADAAGSADTAFPEPIGTPASPATPPANSTPPESLPAPPMTRATSPGRSFQQLTQGEYR